MDRTLLVLFLTVFALKTSRAQTGTCMVDDNLCLTCNAQNPSACSECMPTYGLTPTDNCASCSNPTCTLCDPNVDQCSLCSMFQMGPIIGGNGACAPCSANCFGCTNSGAGKCDIYNCAFGYGTNFTTGLCEPCHVNCMSCVKAGAGKCSTCLNGWGRILSKPFYPDKLSYGCNPCATMFCKYCFVDYHVCQVCLDGWILNPVTLLCQPVCGVVPRALWNPIPAKPGVKPISSQYLPVRNIIVHQTFTKECNTFDQCLKLVRLDQIQQMTQRKVRDIAYNFLIGGDGNVYEGRGANVSGELAPKWDNSSYHVGFIGTFIKTYPNKLAMDAFRRFLRSDCILPKNNNISPMYKIYTHYDIECTICPGGHLRKWIMNNMKQRYGGTQQRTCPSRTWLHAMK